MSLRLSVIGLPISLVAASAISIFVNPVAAIASKIVDPPQVGTVVSMAHGDVACYVTLVDETGNKHKDVPAVFSVCEKEEIFLNKKVTLDYSQAPINDCPPATDCGRTKLFIFIKQMRIASDTQVPTRIGGGERVRAGLFHY
ncbi:MAG TPA: hypothetical protein DCE56_04745 [Cyanobacteria bacterium UBA8553]|nr:hypothetical protein [Cyanobacteria bacterium UBA8553]HAJ61394.1 hypothetical protein [Cyanobacteria bacterium UBA8543]